MRIILKHPITHDGKKYSAGFGLDVSEDTAERLIRMGAAERDRVTAAPPPPAGDVPPPAGDDADDEDPFGGGGDENPLEPKPIDAMSKAELQAELAALGVPYKSSATVSDLKAMLKEAKA